MISTTMNIPINQISQSIKIECKKSEAICVPFFFSNVKETNDEKNIHNKKQYKTTTEKINKKGIIN